MASTHNEIQGMTPIQAKTLSAFGRKQITPIPKHTPGRPPAEHLVKLLVKRMTTDGIQYKPGGTHVPNIKVPLIHPGKALALKQVKAIHLGKPTVKKVVA